MAALEKARSSMARRHTIMALARKFAKMTYQQINIGQQLKQRQQQYVVAWRQTLRMAAYLVAAAKA